MYIIELRYPRFTLVLTESMQLIHIVYPFNSRLIGALAMPLEFRINHRCKTIAFVSVTRSCGFDNLKNKMKRLARSRMRRLIHFNVTYQTPQKHEISAQRGYREEINMAPTAVPQ